MSTKALTLAGVTTAIAILTTVGLNLVAPISLADEAPAKTISVEEVFGGSVSYAPSDLTLSATAAPIEVAQADAGAAMAAGGSATTEAVPAQSSSGGAVASGSCLQGAAGEGDSVVVAGGMPAADTIEGAQAGIEPASAHVTAGGACNTVIASGNAPAIVTATGMQGDAPVPEAAAFDAPAGLSNSPEPASEPQPAPGPEEVAAAKPIAEPAPVAAPAPEPAPKRVSRPKTSKPRVAPPEVKTAWWPANTAGKLNLTYAGDASFTKAIVLLFDGTFDSADSANQNVVVKSAKGESVPGQWLVATANRQMLLFNVDPGLYTVELGGGLTDKGGRALAAAATGPVYIP